MIPDIRFLLCRTVCMKFCTQIFHGITGEKFSDKTSARAENLDPEKNIFISSAEFKYPTMKFEEMERIPVENITSENCLLFMWTTGLHMAQAVRLGTK